MTILIIVAIMAVISISSCVWCSVSQKKIERRYRRPSKKELARIIEMKELMNLELDEALSLTYKEMKK